MFDTFGGYDMLQPLVLAMVEFTAVSRCFFFLTWQETHHIKSS